MADRCPKLVHPWGCRVLPSPPTQRAARHAVPPGAAFAGTARGGASNRAPHGATGTHHHPPTTQPAHPSQDADAWSKHYARYVSIHHELGILHAHAIEPPMRRDVLQLLEATTGRLVLLHAWLTGQRLGPEAAQRVAAATYQVGLCSSAVLFLVISAFIRHNHVQPGRAAASNATGCIGTPSRS